jgi:DNA polymerase sigma
MSVTTQDTNNNINLNLDTPSKAKSSELKNEYNNENEIDNNEIVDNSNDKNNSSNKNSSKKKKKKEMFLFATVKKSKKKSNSNTNNITLISNEFSIITLKDQNSRLSFFDKLHNDIIKYETKVISLLNHGMKFHDFCITEIKRLIQETLNFSNDYLIEVYGSYATGLMIEASDIDIKIKLNKGTKDDLNSFFKKVCEKLEQEKKFDEINPIETASVPVIKLLLSKEKFIKGKPDLENSYKQYKELSLFKHYLFDINELTKIKIDVTFILPKDNLNNNIKEDINTINNNIENNINDIHDHNKSIESELSSVSYVKEQIVKYPEVKFILRVLKRYFYYKKMNTAFLGGLSSYNLFLLLLSYAKFLKLSQNSESTNLGCFLFNFLYFFKVFDFKQYIININSKNNIYDILPPESAKEFNLGKSIVIIDPLTGVNASKSSYKIDDIQNTFSEAFDFFQNEEIKYGKEGKTKINKKNSNKDKTEVMGLPKSNKNENNHGGGNIIEKFLGK